MQCCGFLKVGGSFQLARALAFTETIHLCKFRKISFDLEFSCLE